MGHRKDPDIDLKRYDTVYLIVARLCLQVGKKDVGMHAWTLKVRNETHERLSQHGLQSHKMQQ